MRGQGRLKLQTRKCGAVDLAVYGEGEAREKKEMMRDHRIRQVQSQRLFQLLSLDRFRLRREIGYEALAAVAVRAEIDHGLANAGKFLQRVLDFGRFDAGRRCI